MSYTIHLGNAGDSWNFTSNCEGMWKRAGVDLATFHGKKASECTPNLTTALRELIRNPDVYRSMDNPNGWGTYDVLVPAFKQLLGMLVLDPDEIVHVHS